MFVTESEDEDFGAAVSISDEMVTEPLEVSRSRWASGAFPLALPKRTPEIWLFEFFVRSTSAALNLIEPFEVLASSPMGFRSDRLTEMAPLLVSNLHFPSSAQPIS